MLGLKFASFLRVYPLLCVLACGLLLCATPGARGEDTAPADAPAVVPLPPLPPSPNQAYFGARIQRTMTLLATSTRLRRHRVRILFYGQSITDKAWTNVVIEDLRTRFPDAEITAENRAIGGYTAERLARTAVHDVYPYYPDLLIYQVYGGITDGRFERVLADVRRNTTAEILLITHHVTNKVTALDEVEESAGIRYLAQKYNCELVDLREAWQQYLDANHLPVERLLGDFIHPSREGFNLIAQAVIPHLQFNPLFPSDWFSCVRSYDVKRAVEESVNDEVTFTGAPWTMAGSAAFSRDPATAIKLTFEGNRVDLVAGVFSPRQLARAVGSRTPPPLGTARILIDGQPPSACPSLYAITRPSSPPRAWVPAVRRISHQAPLLVEDWTLKITEMDTKGWKFAYEVTGSKTGPDGTGRSGERFVSNSGRVVIDPGDFEFAWALEWCHALAPVGFEVTWRVTPMFQDTYAPQPAQTPGLPYRVTIAQGLPNGQHTLEIIPNGDGIIPLESIEVYRPPLK